MPALLWTFCFLATCITIPELNMLALSQKRPEPIELPSFHKACKASKAQGFPNPNFAAKTSSHRFLAHLPYRPHHSAPDSRAKFGVAACTPFCPFSVCGRDAEPDAAETPPGGPKHQLS
ncbi:hypothetical protein V8C37DRAFT_368808 [Trichoderma ceciliae]